MSTFRADNTTASALEAFYFRGLYKRDALSQYRINPEIKDFSFAEDVLYGRVDTRLNTVYPDENYMKVSFPENNSERSFRLLDFVTDAFQSVKAAMNSARDNGAIPDNEPFFSKFQIRRAYESPVQLYNDYIDQLMDTYTTEYLIVKNNKKHVLDFSSFVSHFVNFLKNQQFHTPFTFTSWQRSKSSNIFTSGIAIDIANMDFGIDPEIEDSVLTNPCLPYYFKVCRANGFLVSELAPTVMIADILSPGLEPFANKNRIFTTEDVFLSRYNYAYAADYETMQVKLIDAYNFFVAENPFERLVTSKCLKASSVVLKDRLPTNIIEVEKHFPMKKWLYTYAQIRNNEEQGILDKREFKILLKKIKMMKYVDNFKAMRYINDTFRNTYKSKYGGLNYFIKKTRQQNEEIDSSIESITAGSTDGSNGGSSGGY
jgi:hypothetical protein